MKAIIKAVGLMICLTLWFAQEGFAKKNAYQVSPVTHGGHLAGSVSFKGKVPDPIREDMNKGKNAEVGAKHPETKGGGMGPRTNGVVTDGKVKDTGGSMENSAQGKDRGEEGTG